MAYFEAKLEYNGNKASYYFKTFLVGNAAGKYLPVATDFSVTMPVHCT
jgi:hypothetical protein